MQQKPLKYSWKYVRFILFLVMVLTSLQWQGVFCYNHEWTSKIENSDSYRVPDWEHSHIYETSKCCFISSGMHQNPFFLTMEHFSIWIFCTPPSSQGLPVFLPSSFQIPCTVFHPGARKTFRQSNCSSIQLNFLLHYHRFPSICSC